MNRSIFAILLVLLLAVFAGCSSSSSLPTQPDNPQIPSADTQTDKLSLLYEGTFDIDLETQTITQIENRQSDFIYDITGFLPDKCPGGCFRFAIVGVVGTVLEIELTLENPLTIQVYDARVMYLNLFGKTVLNPDSYTDFMGTPITGIYPFTAFAKEDPNRAFPVGPGGMDTVTMFLDFPPGSPSAVNYAITAHLPGMTAEPYEISEMSQTGTLTTTGGSATIRCKVDDHQDNISAVYMNSIPFTGNPVQLTFNDPYYEVEISNTQGAPEGTYNQLIMALSPNGQNISTYNYVEINVSQASGDLVACFTVDPDEVRMEIDPTVYFDGSCSHDDGGYDIVLYEWDFDWDGVPGNFTVDDSTTTPPTNWTYTAPGTYLAGLRVTNNASPAETSPIFSDEIIVHGWVLPPTKLTDPSYTDMWWCVDKRIATTSDGTAHIIASSYYDPGGSKVEYFKCDETGLLFTEEIYAGYISDIGLVVTPNDDFYAFYVKNNGIVYRKNASGTFEPEVYAFSSEPGKHADYSAYAVNSDGDVLAMMSEYGGEEPTQTIPNPAYISYAVDEGSGFSPKTTIATPDRWTNYIPPGNGQGVGITVDAIADSTGVFHMAWDGLPAYGNSNRQIWHAYYDGALSAVSDIAATSTPEFFPLFRVDADDNVWCGYRTYSGNYFSIKYAGNTTFDPSFKIDSNPNNWSYDINPNNGDIMHIQNNKPTGEYHNWCKIYNVSDSPTDMLNAFSFRLDDSVETRQWWPNVAFSPDGHWYAVWDDQRDLPVHVSMGEIFFAMYY
ncbi:PKD domain-containing protein [bacterium]|nr:PKD domain-containing protein [bacterium]